MGKTTKCKFKHCEHWNLDTEILNIFMQLTMKIIIREGVMALFI